MKPVAQPISNKSPAYFSAIKRSDQKEGGHLGPPLPVAQHRYTVPWQGVRVGGDFPDCLGRMKLFTPTSARPLEGAGAFKLQFFVPLRRDKKLHIKYAPPPWGGGRSVGTIAVNKFQPQKTVRGATCVSPLICGGRLPIAFFLGRSRLLPFTRKEG